MEYTERKGKYYIQGIMRVEKTPDGWTLFKRVSPVANEYYPIQGEHYDNIDLALEKAREIVNEIELQKGRRVIKNEKSISRRSDCSIGAYARKL